MSKKHHYLKCETEYFQAQEINIKNFEVRKNDRDYQSGDIVHLEETVNGVKTGRTLQPKTIVYILKGGQFGIDPDYCILQLR